MKKILFLIALALVLFQNVDAQQGIEIKITLASYYYDTLWFGQTYGKRAVPQFFALRNGQGEFELKAKGPIQAGMYAIIFKRSVNSPYNYLQCWVADGQRNFSMSKNINDFSAPPVFTGSAVNVAFYNYLTEFQKHDEILDSLIVVSRLRQDEASFRARVQAEKDLNLFQEKYIESQKGTILAEFIRKHQLLLPPESKADNWEQENASRWKWQKTHYLDRLSFKDKDFMRFPQFLDKLDFLLFYVPPPHPDTTKAVMDLVLSQLQSNNAGAYEYYQKYLTNSLARMSQFQLDEVFVHMVRTYLLAGKAPWTADQDKQRMRNEANMMEPLFVGKKAPDVTLFTKQGEAVSLHKIQAKAILVAFWLPDCSHCQKEMPILKDVWEKYKSKGLQFVSVCCKYYDETPKCWEFAESNSLPEGWYQLADQNAQSRMSILFNLRSMPRLFILDADKNIVLKRAGESSELELSSFLDKLL